MALACGEFWKNSRPMPTFCAPWPGKTNAMFFISPSPDPSHQGRGRKISYHLMTLAALTRPAPKATKTTLSPFLIFLDFLASYKATAIDAADILPYLLMLIK